MSRTTRPPRPAPSRPAPSRRRRRSRATGRAVLAVTALVATLAVGPAGPSLRSAPPAGAVPLPPGVPAPVTDVVVEDFESGLGAATVLLSDYVGSDGRGYSADPHWIWPEQCNGVIVRYEDPSFAPTHCDLGGGTENARRNVRRLADVLGQLASGIEGSSDDATPVDGSTSATRSNHALTAWTADQVGPDGAVLLRSEPLGVAATSARYYTFGVDVAEVSCAVAGGANASRLDFSLEIDGTEHQVNAQPVRACTDASTRAFTSPGIPGTDGSWLNGGGFVRAGRYFADRALLLSPSEIEGARTVVRNQTGQSAGNDSAIDGLRLVDSTPRLDKALSPATVRTGEAATLTFTVTNRSDLGAKLDWGFTDELPAGLVVAPDPGVGGSCVQRGGGAFTVEAAAGAGAVRVTGGDLAADETSCTVTVSVAASAPGTYRNDADNLVELVGLDPPGAAVLEVVAPVVGLLLDKQAAEPVDVDGSGRTDAGDTIEYSFLVTNTGEVSLNGVEVSDPMLGAVSCPGSSLAPGASMTCAAVPYVLTEADQRSGSVHNEATATAVAPGDRPVPPATDHTDTPVDPLPGAVELRKEAIGQPTPTDAGTWVLDYELSVRNPGPGPADYGLVDRLRFGEGVAVLAATATGGSTGGPAVNPSWDGVTDLRVVEDGFVAAGATHRFVVRVEVAVASGITPDSLDCTLSPTEAGTGLLNEAALDGDDLRGDSDACVAPVDRVEVQKSVLGTPTRDADGIVVARYRLRVTNRSEAEGRYELVDEIAWSAAVTVTHARVVEVPSGAVADPRWDGRSATVVAREVPIGPGAVHDWIVEVVGRASGSPGAADARCATDEPGGGGLANRATLTGRGVAERSVACVALPAPPGGSGATVAGVGRDRTGPRGRLSRTGAALVPVAVLGLLVLVGGGVLGALERRRPGRRAPDR